MSVVRSSRFRLLIAAALVLAAGWILLSGGSGTYQVTAVFNQAYGLVDGSRVWSGGGIVGRVSGIRLGRDGLPHLTLTIDDGYRLRASASADLELESNSGELNRIVMLSQGRGPDLPDGAVIGTDHTFEPVEVDDVLGTFSPAVRGEVDAVIAQLDGSTRGLAGAFHATLRHSAAALGQTAALLSQVTNDGFALRTLVREGSIAAGALSAQQQALNASVHRVAQLLTTVAARQAQLRSAVNLLPDGLTAPTRALEAVQHAIPTLTALSRSATPVADQLGGISRLAARTLQAGNGPLQQLASIVTRAPGQLRATRPLLQALSPLAKRLTPVLAQLLPMLDLLRVYTPEIIGYIGDWGDIATEFDAAGHGVTAAFTVVSPKDRTVSPSSNAPGFLAAPYQRDPGALVGQPWSDYLSSFLSRQGARR